MPFHKGVFFPSFSGERSWLFNVTLGRDIMSKCFKFILKIVKPSLQHRINQYIYTYVLLYYIAYIASIHVRLCALV